MDDERFDAFARQLMSRWPRRIPMDRGLAALIALGLASSPVEAKRHNKRHKKKQK